MRNLILLFFLISFSAISQIKPNKYKHQFGELYENAPTYVDFTFKNNSGVNVFLLTVDRPKEVNYIFSKKIIAPDSVFVLRLKVNDRIKGKFNYKVDVYFSDNNVPISLTLTGNVKEKSKNPLTACPDFNKTPPVGGMAQFEITVKVLDSLTLEPIKKSKVYLINNGEVVGEHYTNSDGIIHKKVPLGYYYITAHKPTYQSNYFEGYMNYQSNYAQIKLKQTKTDVVEPPIDSIPSKPVLIVNNPTPLKDTATTPPTKPIEPLANIPPANFDADKFKPNNIVFIVDVSSSMRNKGKLDLLKFSMIELTKILRPQDKVSLLAYAGDVHILLENISGMDKEQINQQIKSLVAQGKTDGGKAIRMGYKLAKKHKLDDGNNLIFMVTDGAFNKGQTKYKKVIRFNHRFRKIKFTVVGIKTSVHLTKSMEHMASIGGGKYVKITTIEEAQIKLFEEIRRTSYRGY